VSKPNCFALSILLAVALIPAQLSSQAEKPTENLSAASIGISEAQIKRIRQELRHLNRQDDWAGEYYFGDGLGVNVSLALAPNNGFVFSWTGCLGLYDLNYGDIAFSDGAVKLLFKHPNERRGFQGIAPELLPVRWGERHYLIAADDVVKFTNAINSGTEPNTWRGGPSTEFLLRQGDEKKKVFGEPNLPNQYLSYLLKKPIQTKISSIVETRTEQSRRVTSILLDAGSANGLQVGMELYVHKPSKVWVTATVTRVDEHSSRAVIEQEMTDPSPASTWIFSTKP
jgi:hypothetical protein